MQAVGCRLYSAQGTEPIPWLGPLLLPLLAWVEVFICAMQGAVTYCQSVALKAPSKSVIASLQVFQLLPAC